jgi:cell fate (sporulation/competence/biofilm development) regulator YmcA (YheA/YmcA/DUF963 family)
MNKLIDKATELTNIVQKQPNYQEYIILTKQVKEHKEINELTTKVKDLQKEAVKLEHELKEDVTNINDEIENTIIKLNDIPLYHHYTAIIEDLDSVFSLISNELSLYIEELINF